MSGTLLRPGAVARLSADSKPLLLVVIDTEEEFEWGAGFFRDKTTVRAMAGIHRVQEVFDEFGIRPTYVIDYPVATQEEGYAALREYQRDGRAIIGAHLHPWVNPPHEEETTSGNSFPGNLPAALEERKIEELTRAIEETFGERPVIYKAGRYGIGENTQTALERLGYEFDLSVYPRTDQTAEGGPNFRDFAPDPYWFGERRLLEIPVTNGFVGWLHPWGVPLTRLAQTPLARTLRAQGILSRLRALELLRLTPEGMDTPHHKTLTRALVDRGVRVFTFSFHSPSAMPGHTPYVRTEADLEAFLDCCRRYFEFFLNELGGVAETPFGIRERLGYRAAVAS